MIGVFWSMIRPLLRSILFPYTTLFRSDQQKVREWSDALVGDWDADPAKPQAALDAFGGLIAQRRQQRGEDLMSALIEDRKSTRLNSSHPSISYAVFCLKKKREEVYQAA